MKRVYCFLTYLVCLLFAMPTRAEKDDKDALQTMERVAMEYENSEGVTASFQLFVLDASGKEVQRAIGKIEMKGEKFHFKTEEFEVWYDGVNQWSSQDEREVNLTQPDIEEVELHTPALLFKYYKKIFTCVSLNHVEDNGVVLQEVELKPIKEEMEVEKIVCRFTLHDIPHYVELLQKNGMKMQLYLSNYQKHVLLTENCFSYDAKQYPEREIVDLR